MLQGFDFSGKNVTTLQNNPIGPPDKDSQSPSRNMEEAGQGIPQPRKWLIYLFVDKETEAVIKPIDLMCF